MLSRVSRGLRPVGTQVRAVRFASTNYKSDDSNVDNDEIISSNNPWSPTLYNDIVYVKEPGAWRAKALPENYRLSYQPLYESPGAKYVSLLKRLSLSFSVLGIYASKLFFESVQFEDIYAYTTLASCTVPALLVQYKTKDYVTRIFRLYNKDKPQTLENLTSEEKLVMEKLNMTGGKTYNEVLTVSDNKSLKLTPPNEQRLWKPYSTWNDSAKHYYVADDIGGIKMDRLWGIVEHNSGIDTGRYMEDEISK